MKMAWFKQVQLSIEIKMTACLTNYSLCFHTPQFQIITSFIKALHTWSPKDNIEVKTVDTDGGVVLDTKINVLLDTETEVASGGEIITPQLVFPNLEAKYKTFN